MPSKKSKESLSITAEDIAKGAYSKRLSKRVKEKGMPEPSGLPTDEIRERFKEVEGKVIHYLDNEKGHVRPPGMFIALYLEAANLEPQIFGTYLNLEKKRLKALLEGDMAINVNLALLLERLFGTDAMLWMMLESRFRIKRRRDRKDAGHESAGRIISDLNLEELIQLSIVTNPPKPPRPELTIITKDEEEEEFYPFDPQAFLLEDDDDSES